MSLYLPIRLVSPNRQEHWSKRHKRNKILQLLVNSEYNKLEVKPSLPCHIHITRIAPRQLDLDNYIASAKGLIDRLADKLIPGLPSGRADGDPRLSFSYSQERGKPKEYAVRVEFKKRKD